MTQLRTDLINIPNRDWNKTLEKAWEYRGRSLQIFSVQPQAHLIASTMPVGLLSGFSADAILTKAFQKNYHSEAAKPGVVSNYGFEQAHGEPIEMIDFVYETIFDRACEAEMNRYRHNSKNLESGRYVDYTKHGLTIVLPEDVKYGSADYKESFLLQVKDDLEKYVDVIEDAPQEITPSKRKQMARRRIGMYIAVEGTYKVNLRSLSHMATQRSATYSPNGKEAEPQISSVVTQMVDEATPYIPVFAGDLMKQISKGYR